MDNLYHYSARKLGGALKIDGDLTKPAWQAAEKSRYFVDMVTGAPAFFKTQVAALWDAERLYIGYWLSEPSVRASQTERDSLVWYDNDAELFLAGDDCYYEFQINALNTVYEVFFVYQSAYKKGGRFDTAEFDLTTRDVDVLCGFQDPLRYKKNAGGKRWAFMDWDFPGLETAVKVDGHINDESTLCNGWTVEMALPWEGFRTLKPSQKFPPKPGDHIRAQFFRFQSLKFNGKTLPDSPGWSLGVHGVYDSHIPEKFVYIDFAD